MALGPSTTGSERTAALSRMVAALEAAKRARDSGHNVQQVRGMLKAARSAFEAGDYPTAARLADQVWQPARTSRLALREGLREAPFSSGCPKPSAQRRNGSGEGSMSSKARIY
jgi:hypothetical protein